MAGTEVENLLESFRSVPVSLVPAEPTISAPVPIEVHPLVVASQAFSVAESELVIAQGRLIRATTELGAANAEVSIKTEALAAAKAKLVDLLQK